WQAVPPLVRIMALALMALAPAFMTYPLLVSAGHIRAALLASLISLPPSGLLIFAAAPHGLLAVAASFLISAPVQMAIALLFIRRVINLHWAELAKAAASSAVVVVGTMAIPVLIVVLSPNGFDLTGLETLAAVLGGATGWLLSVTLAGHALRDEVAKLYVFARSRLSKLARQPVDPD
ncbi:MAG: polysaccharide biosynthesis protein, partial [Paracoccaceae bacterium]